MEIYRVFLPALARAIFERNSITTAIALSLYHDETGTPGARTILQSKGGVRGNQG